MDFSFATTQSATDWRDWVWQNVELRDAGVALESTPTVRGDQLDVRGAALAVDVDGTLSVIREGGSLYRYDPSTDVEHRVWRRDESPVGSPSGICATGDRVFVADGATVTAVSTHLQRTIGTTRTGAVPPVALASGGGTAYVLGAEGRLIAVGDGEDDSSDPAWWLEEPVDLGVDDSGVAYVLDRNDGDHVVRAVRGNSLVESGALPVTDFETEDGRTFAPVGLAVASGRLVVVGDLDGGDAALFEWVPTSATFVQRHRFDGPCHALTGRLRDGRDSSLELFALVGDERTVTRLEETRRNARDPETGRHVGSVWTYYDSGAAGTEWHRVTLALAGASANTQVRLRYLARDRVPLRTLEPVDGLPEGMADALEAAGVASTWALARSSVRDVRDAVDCSPGRAEALVAAATAAIREHATDAWTSVEGFDPADVLLESASGRYLCVGLELVGGTQTSPRIEAVRAYCPRQSYLRHMPEVYQEDDRSAAFLERFLSVFESTFAGIEEEFERFGRFLDPDGVPSEYLDWLESWLAASPPVEWPDSARREFLDRAPELYRQRGTLAGMRALVDLYLRHTTGRSRPDPPDAGPGLAPAGTDGVAAIDGTAETDGDLPSGHRLFFREFADTESIDRRPARAAFRVNLPDSPSFVAFCGPFDDPSHGDAVERIVEATRPAHVACEVTRLDRECALDGATFLGLNSELATREFSLGQAALGSDAILRRREHGR